MTMTLLPTPRAALLTFTAPPPGFEPLTDFELSDVAGAPGLYSLQDTAGADLRLFLIDPVHYVPEYAPRLGAEDLTALGTDSADELDVYVVATIQRGTPVVNLLAPILVNPTTNAAAQVILDEDWPLQAELIAPAA